MRKLRWLMAILAVFALTAAACSGGSDDSSADTDTSTEAEDTADEGAEDEGEMAEDEGADDEGEMAEDEGDGEAAAPPADLETGDGVVGDTIRIGINGDLSGPFSALVSEIVESQKVYWEQVNDNGGIEGFKIEPVILDSAYDTVKGGENYKELAQEGEDGVLMISENTGSPITATIAESAIDDDMLVIPLSWASLWPDPDFGANVLEKQTTYCVESMNGIDWMKRKVEADGKEAKLAIIGRPGEYGEDGSAGAEIAAEELGIEIVYDGRGAVAGDDNTAVISELVGSGATMVWVTLTPAELTDIFGNAVSQGLDAVWSGNGPSFSYPVHMTSDIADQLSEYYYQSGYSDVWNGSDSEGMNDVVSAMREYRPDAQLSDQFITGWMEGIMVETLIRQAIANGELTRAGMVRASQEVTMDFKGLSPNQTFSGSYDDVVVRDSYIYDVDVTKFNLQPVTADDGSTGLIVEEGPFTSDIVAGYEFGGPCIEATS